MHQELHSKVIIIIQRGQVYLSNQLDETIKQLNYRTFSMVTMDDEVGISDAPQYQIRDIPAGHIIHLETLDGWEDGAIYYELVSLKTASIDIKEGFTLHQKKLSGLVSLPPLADAAIEKIDTQKGFVVNMDNTTGGNELYWLVEDLKAYTDLTGSNFDTEKAQMKLWKMNPVFKKYDFPEMQAIQKNLLGQLEIPIFFDKEAFSKKVDELYQEAEKMKKK